MPFSGPFRYYSIFVLLFVTIRRFGGPLLLVHVVTSANQLIFQQDAQRGLGVKSLNLVFFDFIDVLVWFG